MTKKIIPSRSKSTKICTVENCTNTNRVRKGLCNAHALRLQRRGTLELTRKRNICNVIGCFDFRHGNGFCHKHNHRFKKYGDPNFTLLKVAKGNTPQEKFWNRVNKDCANGCWEWQGNTINTGYGAISFEGRKWLAHRLAWFLAFNSKPTQFLLHSCDNRRCCNPSHLREGTAKQNSEDMVARNRQCLGEKQARSKLSSSQVKIIKQKLLNKEKGVDIAKEFGVAKETIHSIKSGKNWRHIKI